MTAPVLAAEPLVGVGERWRLVGGQTVKGEFGTSHDSGENVLLGLAVVLVPFSHWG